MTDGTEITDHAHIKEFVENANAVLVKEIEDKVAGTGRIHVIKNRFGPDGITFPSKINTNNGNFDVYSETSVQGAELKSQMGNHEEYLRKEMKKRFEELED